jgi:hypothetical protein
MKKITQKKTTKTAKKAKELIKVCQFCSQNSRPELH